MSAPPPPQPTQTWRFDSVGQGFQTWTVPDGVSAVTAIVAGASGGQTNPKVCAVRERKLRRIDFLLTVEGSRISRATA
jgi:hypothetical protein